MNPRFALVLLAACLVVGCSREPAKAERVDDPNVTEADIGAPFYPGSAPTQQGNDKITAGTKITVYSDRTTTDSPQMVADFYRSKMGQEVEGGLATPDFGYLKYAKPRKILIEISHIDSAKPTEIKMSTEFTSP